ncbi:MAG: hypothetical protein M3N59_03180 [bacterium]|nr:hypothetical protein [bacterium]
MGFLIIMHRERHGKHHPGAGREDAPEPSVGAPDFRVDPVDYRILTLENLRDPDTVLQRTVSQTDKIIGVLDGSIPAESRTLDKIYQATSSDQLMPGVSAVERIPADELPQLGRPDMAIYLDKSGRPVSWLVRKLWGQLATPEPDGSTPRMPETRFFNIDRIDWLRRVGVPEHEIEGVGPEGFEMRRIAENPSAVRELLARFRLPFVEERRTETGADGEKRTIELNESNWLDEVWKMPLKAVRRLDGSMGPPRHITVIDEMKSSGATLHIARELFATALPEVAVSGTHWSVPKKKSIGTDRKSGVMQTTEETAPPWYRRDLEAGRGVGDLDRKWYADSDSNWKVKRVGEIALSTPLTDVEGERIRDKRAQVLRDDIDQLVQDLANRRVLYVPSMHRRPEESLRRIEELNGIPLVEWQRRRGIAPRNGK